jgi:uncharacterized membrane protein YgaE (UPF0421/DUF939 family)
MTDGYRKKFGVVNEKTVATVCSLILQQVDQMLKEMESVFDKLKTNVSRTSEQAFGEEERLQQETQICQRLGELINLLREFTNSKLSPGPIVKEIMDREKKLFDFLSLLSQYYSKLLSGRFGDKSRSKLASLPEPFVAVIKKCGAILCSRNSEFLTNSDNSPAATRKRKLPKKGDEQGKIRVVKKRKETSALVMAFEGLQHHLLDLQIKAKISLVRHFKVGHIRDYVVDKKVASIEVPVDSQMSANTSQPMDESVG